MPWPGTPFASLFLLLLVATVGPPGAHAEGNVGCLFSERLCLEDEWCYDDFAFGRCLQSNGDIDTDDLFRYNLEREILHQISRELRRLFALGYRWSHGYTQCRLQAMLYATKNDVEYDNNACSHLVDQDLEGALKAMEGQDNIVDPHEMAIVKYTPSAENPHADFADEVYYPPADDGPQKGLRQRILAPEAVDLDMEDPYAQYEVIKRATGWIPQMHRRSIPPYSPYDDPEADPAVQPEISYLDELLKEAEQKEALLDYLKQYNGRNDEEDAERDEENDERLKELLSDMEDERERYEKPYFGDDYNTPDGFRAGWESRDATIPSSGDDMPESRIYFDENDESGDHEYGSGAYNAVPGEIFRELARSHNNMNNEIFRELKNKQDEPNAGIYTEGGVVYAPTHDLLDKNLDNILNEYGFKRPERLDVKKPGPMFDTHNLDDKRAVPNSHKQYKESLANQMQAKEQQNANNDDDDNVDTDYVYVEFKNNVYTWAQGNQIIGNISHLLKLEPSAFSHGRVDRNEVTFKVEPNRLRMNATQVARKIDTIRDQLKEITGIEITAAGIGDRSKMKAIFAPQAPEAEFYIIFFTVCALLLALVIGALLLLFLRHNLKVNEKLQGIARPDTEASKDYQDLCRARMAGKNPPETVHGRITSLSRESEQSPSSRSSTSSWSEEPALHNMDISTGHMVLTYMEDHLKNKDRLEQEWVALCAYVAEPCETSVALKKDNKEKNRYPEIVPYDHARVVLNELSNINSSDYINASSITDHDPRNPAYIATQGPLPHTAADFWQLIWEQGAVVIVMLSRLTEGGAAMCHRYWPEEGSELYHIYEVHLVSEHIWCDDYLVRSFYLKNVRTGETRTVTQFHFLSWPEAGVPASTKALLEFRRKVNKSYRGRSCPIVVHCSDGAGRTGTYCLIDMVLSRMAKGAKEIDIAATLEHLRDQRAKMVATKQQFEFVLTAVAEEVHAILKALPPQPAPLQNETQK